MSEDVKKITVSVRRLSGSTINVEVNADCTVKELAKEIVNQEQIYDLNYKKGSKAFMLKFNGGTITEPGNIGKKISELGIDDDGLIVNFIYIDNPKSQGCIRFDELLGNKDEKRLSQKKQKEKQAEKIKVNIKVFGGKTVKIELFKDSTVSDLAKAITREFSNQSNQEKDRKNAGFRLAFSGGCIIADDCTSTKINSVSTINNDDKIQKQSITNGSDIFVMFFGSDFKKEGNQNNKYFYFDDYLSVKEKKKERNEKQDNNDDYLSVKEKEKKKEQNEKQDNNSNGNESSWPPFRIGIGIADLLLFAAAVVAFLLKIHIVIVIIFIVLFIIDTALLCGWHYILPKILPEALLKMIGLKTNVLQKDQNKAQKDIPKQRGKDEEEKIEIKVEQLNSFN